MNKLKLALVGLACSGLTALAQNIIPGGATPSFEGYVFDEITNTGTALQNYNSNGDWPYYFNVWESDGDSYVKYDGTTYGGLASGVFTLTGALDPDVESTHLEHAFVGYYKTDGVYVNVYNWNTTLLDYELANVIKVTTTTGARYVNIDAENDQGLITWQDGMDVYATTFDTQGAGVVTFIDQGVHPDIIRQNSKDYTIVFSDYYNNLDIRTGDLPNLNNGMATFFETHEELAGGGYYYLYPRIAKPNSVINIGDVDFTVTAKRRLLSATPEEMIIGLTRHDGVYSYYEVSENCTNSKNNFPVVTYNHERIIFMWASDYESPNSAPWMSSMGRRDILSREIKYFVTTNTLSDIMPGNYYELNTVQNEGYENCRPSITWGLAPEVNDTQYLFYTTGLPYNSLFNKRLKKGYQLDQNRRLTGPQETNLDLVQMDHAYSLLGENLNNYQFQMTNLAGQKIDISNRMNLSDSEMTLDIDGLTSGIYFLNVINGEHSECLKLIVTQ